MPDRFYFFSRSLNKPPGEGGRENAHAADYTALGALGEWRQMLSNCHSTPFFWRGYSWNSVEHAFQAMKIGMQDHTKAYNFTVESGHHIGQGDGAHAQRHGKCVELTHANINMWAAKSASVMHDAATAMYAQCPEAAAVLDATGDAELYHIAPRGRSHRFYHLESIRARRRAATRCAPVKPPKGDPVARAAREARAVARATASDERDDDKADDAFYVKYH